MKVINRYMREVGVCNVSVAELINDNCVYPAEASAIEILEAKVNHLTTILAALIENSTMSDSEIISLVGETGFEPAEVSVNYENITTCNDSSQPDSQVKPEVFQAPSASVESDYTEVTSKRTFYIDVPDPTAKNKAQLVDMFQIYDEQPSNTGHRFNTFGRSSVHRERYFHVPISQGDARFLTLFAREVAPDTNFWQFSYYPTKLSHNLHKKVARSLARRSLMVARQQSSRKDNDPNIYFVCADAETLFESMLRYLHGQKVIEIE